MKISLIDDVIYRYAANDPTAAGGAERYMWLQTRALAAAGWSATVGVWTALPPGERTRIDGVDFVGVERGDTIRAVYRFLRAERPDRCHWFGSSHILGPAIAAGKLVGTRAVFSAQFDLDVRPRQALHARRRLWPLYALGLWASDRIFLQHRGQYAGLAGTLRSKAHIVPGIVALPPAWQPHDGRTPYVAWVGVLRQPKRPDLLVEIAEQSPGVNFVVCGGPSGHRSPPEYSDSIIQPFQKVPNIRYLGHVAPARAIEVIGNAAVLLSTSDAEGFPSVFVEAWAHGTPVVSLKIDPDQMIAENGLGAVSGSVSGAVKDIARLVEAPEQRQVMAARCRDYVATHHSSAAAVRIVEQALVGRSAPSLKAAQGFGRP